MRNGGFTYAGGFTFEGDIGVKANVAVGGFMAVNFANMDVNYGLYGTSELGSKLGMPIPALNIGQENTIFTSPDFKNALVGKYSLYGAGDNYRNTGRSLEASYIRAANGEISGSQFTTELISLAPKVESFRDPNAYSHRGYGIIYDANAGIWRIK